MSASITNQNDQVQQSVVVRPEPPGQFTAQVVGLPELCATAGTVAESLQQVRAMLGEWLASGRLVPMQVPSANPLLCFSGHLDPNDPLEQQFVETLARLRREDTFRRTHAL